MFIILSMYINDMPLVKINIHLSCYPFICPSTYLTILSSILPWLRSMPMIVLFHLTMIFPMFPSFQLLLQSAFLLYPPNQEMIPVYLLNMTLLQVVMSSNMLEIIIAAKSLLVFNMPWLAKEKAIFDFAT